MRSSTAGRHGHAVKTKPDSAQLAELERIMPSWRTHLPQSAQRVVIAKVKAMPASLVADFIDKYQTIGRDWGFMPRSELSHAVMHAMISHVEKGQLRVLGEIHAAKALAALRAGEIRHLCIVCNHRSYADALIIQTALTPLFKRFGFTGDYAAVVGPKAFGHPCRKFAALSFNTIQVAQSRSIATPEVALSLPEIAKAARSAINDIANHTKIMQIFPEGGRSRSGQLMPFLPGAWRLLNAGKPCGLLPLSLSGTEKFLPVGGSKLRRSKVVLRVGPMRPLHEFGAGRIAMEEIARAVASLLPPSKRGCYR